MVGLLFFLILILILQLIVPYLYDHSQPVIADTSIRLLTYNVHDNDLTDIAPLLKKFNPDVIALQEIDQDNPAINLTQSLNELGEYLGIASVTFPAYSYETYGMAILSRFPSHSPVFRSFKTPSYTTPRGVLRVMIESPLGSIQVLTTHLNTPNFYIKRVQELDSILSHFEVTQNTVLMGDFNTPNSVLDVTYHRLLRNFEDSWVIAGNHPSFGKTYHVNFPFLRIDYIFVSADIAVIADSAQLFGRSGPSDHLGLLVDIQP